MKTKPFNKPLGSHAQSALSDLRQAAGHLRACNRFDEARTVQTLADALDPFDEWLGERAKLMNSKTIAYMREAWSAAMSEAGFARRRSSQTNQC